MVRKRGVSFLVLMDQTAKSSGGCGVLSVVSVVKDVGLVYIDVTGCSRKAIIKSVAKGMVVGRTAAGQDVIVGGEGAIEQRKEGEGDGSEGMSVVEGKKGGGSGNGVGLGK